MALAVADRYRFDGPFIEMVNSGAGTKITIRNPIAAFMQAPIIGPAMLLSQLAPTAIGLAALLVGAVALYLVWRHSFAPTDDFTRTFEGILERGAKTPRVPASSSTVAVHAVGPTAREKPVDPEERLTFRDRLIFVLVALAAAPFIAQGRFSRWPSRGELIAAGIFGVVLPFLTPHLKPLESNGTAPMRMLGRPKDKWRARNARG